MDEKEHRPWCCIRGRNQAFRNPEYEYGSGDEEDSAFTRGDEPTENTGPDAESDTGEVGEDPNVDTEGPEIFRREILIFRSWHRLQIFEGRQLVRDIALYTESQLYEPRYSNEQLEMPEWPGFDLNRPLALKWARRYHPMLRHWLEHDYSEGNTGRFISASRSIFHHAINEGFSAHTINELIHNWRMW